MSCSPCPSRALASTTVTCNRLCIIELGRNGRGFVSVKAERPLHPSRDHVIPPRDNVMGQGGSAHEGVVGVGVHYDDTCMTP